MGWRSNRKTFEEDLPRLVSLAVLILGLIIIGLLLRLIIREQRGLLGVLLAGVSIAVLIYWIREARRAVKEELKPIAVSEDHWIYEVMEGDEDVTLVAQVPGPEDEVGVNLLEDSLEVRGGGNFYRKIRLPSRVRNYRTTYRNGVLEVKMRKS